MPNPKAELLQNIIDEMWSSGDWIDPMEPLLQDWPVDKASAPLAENITSVVAMINHTAFWEDFAHRNLIGESIKELEPLADAEHGKYPAWMPKWPETVDNYIAIRNRIRSGLESISDEDLAIKPISDNVTREYRIFSRAIHGAYHAGQLSFMRRLAGLPDAKYVYRSSDTAPLVPGSKELLTDMMESAWSSGYSIDPFTVLTDDLSVEDAQREIHGLRSIEEIVNHMAFWETYVATRLEGKDTTDMPAILPGDAPPAGPEWPEARSHMLEQHAAVQNAFNNLDDEALALPRPGIGKSFEEGHSGHWLVYGIINHHAYHVGQIVLIRQLMGHSDYLI